MLGIIKRVGMCKFEFIAADPIIMKAGDDKEGDIKKLTQLYTSELEKLISENGPEQWMWAHRRWLDLRGKTVRT
jgi:lauroyl/myristoyl acyltransferase